jgi:hypothetical protein
VLLLLLLLLLASACLLMICMLAVAASLAVACCSIPYLVPAARLHLVQQWCAHSCVQYSSDKTCCM